MILYKYLPPIRLDILKNARLRFTQPGDFNDPFEFKPRIDGAITDDFTRRYVEQNFDRLVDEQLAKYGEIVRFLGRDQLRAALMARKEMLPELFKFLDPDLIAATSRSLNRLIDDNVGILCLSELRDSLLMWGHYTENHSGFVVGFDSDHPFFSKRRSNQDEFGFLRRVIYQRQRPGVILVNSDSPAWFQSKSEDWDYEKEWRIARVLADADHRIEGGAFPICLFDFPRDCVLEVILGIRTKPEFEHELETVLSEFPRATLLKAVESPTEYSLIIENVRTRSQQNQ